MKLNYSINYDVNLIITQLTFIFVYVERSIGFRAIPNYLSLVFSSTIALAMYADSVYLDKAGV